MVDILKNGNDYQIVKLSESYNGFSRALTTAMFNATNVVIDRLFSERKPKRFSFTTEEMNALFEAWQQFKHTMQVAEELHEKHIDH